MKLMQIYGLTHKTLYSLIFLYNKKKLKTGKLKTEKKNIRI